MEKVEISQNVVVDYAAEETNVLVHTPPPEEVSDFKTWMKKKKNHSIG